MERQIGHILEVVGRPREHFGSWYCSWGGNGMTQLQSCVLVCGAQSLTSISIRTIRNHFRSSQSVNCGGFLMSFASICFGALRKPVDVVTTFLYREILKRNTLKPMTDIINERRPELQRRPFRHRARTKTREATYIQLAVSVSD